MKEPILEHSVQEESLLLDANLLKAITKAQSQFIANVDTHILFDELLNNLLLLTQSEYGFIGEILHESDGNPYLKTHAITNIAWNDETRAFYEKHAATGLEFRNLKSLFGAVMVTGEKVISNNPSEDPRRCGIPKGHPPLNAFLGLPFYNNERMVGMVGIANRPNGYDEKLVEFLQPFLSTCSNIIEAHRIDKKNKQLEHQLLHAQKMEALGQLAGGIAHDFNNILTAIMGYGNILLMKKKEDKLAREYSQHIVSLSEKAAILTHGLLSFSRKQTSNCKPLDLNKFIEGIERLLSRVIREDIEFKTSLSEEKLVVMADKGQMEQVLMNLINNAKDSMSQGGRLTLSTGLEEFDGKFVKTHGRVEGGAYACICVSDTGLGMDEETKERIFEPFFTTKGLGKGTGLGLSIVYGIVTQHSGHIDVYSEPGVGTAFKVYLPVYKSDAKAIEVTPDGPALRGGAETILVAEDNEEARKFIAAVLEEFGYNVIEAINGEDALNKFKENRQKVQLAILDVVMPKKNGREVCDEIKKISPTVKVVFTSGYPESVIKRTMSSKEYSDLFIPKPITSTKFLRKVREVLDG